MKKLFLFLFSVIVFTSCSLDDDDRPNYSFEILPIDSYIIPDEFVAGETYEIRLGYTKPNECFEFNELYFLSNNYERTVAIIASIDNNLNCPGNPVEDEATFNFFVNGSIDHYVFKFWQGKDVNGNDMYTIVEVPVVN